MCGGDGLLFDTDGSMALTSERLIRCELVIIQRKSFSLEGNSASMLFSMIVTYHFAKSSGSTFSFR